MPLPRATVLSPAASLAGGVALAGATGPALAGGASAAWPVSLRASSYSCCVITPFFSNSFRAGSAAPAGIATPRSQAVTTRAEIVERRMVLSPLLPNLVNLYPQKILASRIPHRHRAELAVRRRRRCLPAPIAITIYTFRSPSSRPPFREKNIKKIAVYHDR